MRRRHTLQPLVDQEISDDGMPESLVPAGRQFADPGSYGLNEMENFAFQVACDRLRGITETIAFPGVGAAMAAAGLSTDTDEMTRANFMRKYNEDHASLLPTAFLPLADGDPHRYVGEVFAVDYTGPASAPATIGTPVTSGIVGAIDAITKIAEQPVNQIVDQSKTQSPVAEAIRSGTLGIASVAETTAAIVALPQSVAAPSSEKDSHVLVHNDSVSAIGKVANYVEANPDQISMLFQILRHVFHF